MAGELRRCILDGRLPLGSRLLGSRAIAAELGCSRNIVLAALDLLYAEGYLLSTPRGGVTVAKIGRMQPAAPGPAAPADGDPDRWMSRRWRAVLAPDYAYDLSSTFSPGTPDFSQFPFEVWARLLRQAWRRPGAAECLSIAPTGHAGLRQATAEFLGAVRGLLCRVEDVAITNGSAGALDLCARMLVDPGDEVWIEEPGFVEARWSMTAAGARLVPVPVDGKGLCVAEAIRRAPKARLAIVTPSNQYPLGVVMALERRLELLEWAERSGAWIIEDDYNSEFRHRDSMVASLKSLDRAGRVIYLGTFSKLMMPSLRLGYLVAAPGIIDGFARGRARIDVQSAGTAQPALAEFLRQGHLLRYLRKMRDLYAARQQALLQALHSLLPDALDAAPTAAGLHLTAFLRPALAARMTDREAAHRASGAGAVIQPLSQCYVGAPTRQGLIFGYGRLRAEDAMPGIACVARRLHGG